MATNTITPATNIPPLDFEDKFRSLMNIAISEGSIYKAALDKIEKLVVDIDSTLTTDPTTNEDIVNTCEFSKSERAKLIADMVANMVVPLTNSAMSSAFTWAKEERDAPYEYAKVKAYVDNTDANTDVTLENVNKAEKDAKLANMKVLEAMASLKRDYGVTSPITPDSTSITLGNVGSKYSAILANDASTYATLARSYRDSGSFNSITKNGTTYSFNPTKATSTGCMDAGLIAMQTMGQFRQYTAYDDNRYQHALNSYTSLVAGAADSFETFSALETYLTKAETMINNLATPQAFKSCAP